MDKRLTDVQRFVVPQFKHGMRIMSNIGERARRSLYPPVSIRYASVDSFLALSHYEDGIHLIPLETGIYLPLLLLNSPLTNSSGHSRIPVFFSGSIGDRRGMKPPFFSGRGYSQSVGRGILAFSDPLYDVNTDILLGWYTGKPQWRTKETIACLLLGLQEKYGNKYVCVGGSGGGFAALETASRIHDTQALVWNPQTSIMAFTRNETYLWLNAVFAGEDWLGSPHWWREGRKRLTASGVVHDVTEVSLPDEGFLFLQNDDDWYLASQYAPFVQGHEMTPDSLGAFTLSDQYITLFGHFGQGHHRPPKSLIFDALNMMTDTRATIRDIHAHIRARYHDFFTNPSINRLPKELQSLF